MFFLTPRPPACPPIKPKLSVVSRRKAYLSVQDGVTEKFVRDAFRQFTDRGYDVYLGRAATQQDVLTVASCDALIVCRGWASYKRPRTHVLIANSIGLPVLRAENGEFIERSHRDLEVVQRGDFECECEPAAVIDRVESIFGKVYADALRHAGTKLATN